MDFLSQLFGLPSNTVLTMVFALALVLVMIVAGVWLLKLFFRASGNIGRGRNRRLMLVDAMNIDQKRQLLIVRRDNVEHVILTGGPQDVVVETGIPVEKPVAPVRRPVPVPGAGPKAAPQPVRPATTVIEDIPVVAAPDSTDALVPPPRTPAQRLREFARPASQRAAGKSLRHTGLLRPVARENAEPRIADSATTAAVEPRGSAKRDDGNFGSYRSDLKTDGN